MTDRWVSRLPERESEVDTMSKSKHNHEVKDYSAKAPIIEEIKNLLDSCQSAVIVDYRGLTVEEDTALRKKFRESGVVYKVLKNTYIKRAADELGITGLDADLNGLLLSLSASRILRLPLRSSRNSSPIRRR